MGRRQNVAISFPRVFPKAAPLCYIVYMKRWFFPGLALLILLAPGCKTQPTTPPAPEATAAVFLPVLSPSPTPAAAAEPAAPQMAEAGGSYTFGWISDTQHYSQKYPDIFHAMTSYLYRERESLNLRYVIHTGDLVHKPKDENQWRIARHAMDGLKDIPYGVLAGNHDVVEQKKKHSYPLFEEYFGEDTPQPAGPAPLVFENYRGHGDLISAGNTDYLFVYLSWPVQADAIAWANETFAAYPDRVGVLCVHEYFSTDLERTEQGERIFEEIVKRNDNLYLVLCGHRYNCRTVPVSVANADGSSRTVLQGIGNYQSAGKEGGSGYLRLLTVDETAATLRLVSYSPLLDDYGFFDDPENRSDPYYFDPMGENEVFPLPWKE